MGSSVFISYSHQDRAYVEKLVAFLTAADVSVWYDYEIHTGDPFSKRIQAAIDASAALIVVLTPASIASEWVGKELARAIRLGKPIRPLTLINSTPESEPLELEGLIREDVTAGRMPSEKFVAELRKRTAAVTQTSDPLAVRAATTAIQDATADSQEFLYLRNVRAAGWARAAAVAIIAVFIIALALINGHEQDGRVPSSLNSEARSPNWTTADSTDDPPGFSHDSSTPFVFRTEEPYVLGEQVNAHANGVGSFMIWDVYVFNLPNGTNSNAVYFEPGARSKASDLSWDDLQISLEANSKILYSPISKYTSNYSPQTVKLTAPGPYRLKISSRASGDYSFNLRPTSVHELGIAPGDRISSGSPEPWVGKFSSRGEQHIFRFATMQQHVEKRVEVKVLGSCKAFQVSIVLSSSEAGLSSFVSDDFCTPTKVHTAPVTKAGNWILILTLNEHNVSSTAPYSFAISVA